jgi:hypothetical protein
VASIKYFARPLGWVVDLDVQGTDAQILAEFLRSLPHPKRRASWPYGAVAVWAELNLEWFATVDVPERNLLLLDMRASRQRVLPPLIERCATLGGYVSLVGVALVARRTRDAATDAALRRLTRDWRVIERLGL